MPEHERHAQFDDELLSAYLDDELAPDERAQVEARLGTDPAARRMLDQLRAVSQAVRSLPQESVGADLRDVILRRAQDAKPDAKSQPFEAERAMPRWTVGRSARGWVWAGLAVAAALLIMVYQPGVDDQAGLPRQVAHRAAESEESRGSPAAGGASMVAARSAGEGRELTATPPAEPTTLGVPLAASGDSSSPESELERRFAASESTERVDAGNVGGADALAARGVTTAQPSPAAGEGQLLVVHVHVKPAAFRAKSFDGLLARNGIVLEEPPADDRRAAQPAGTVTAQEEAPRSGERLSEPPTANQDVLLVDAPAAQVELCLADLDADTENYLAVNVDDQLATEKGEAAKSIPAEKWQQYNRGRVPAELKIRVTPHLLNDESLERESISGLGGYYRRDAASESSARKRQVQPTEQRGRAMRMQAAQQESDWSQLRQQLSLDKITSAPSSKMAADEFQARGKQDAAASGQDTDTIQVLFVLSADVEATPSPSGDNRAE